MRVTFDPAVLSYDALLDVFFATHDPTTLNRQGHDVGDNYRSIILTLNDAQKAAAEKSKAAEAKNWSDPIVTQIEPLKVFQSWPSGSFAAVTVRDANRSSANSSKTSD